MKKLFSIVLLMTCLIAGSSVIAQSQTKLPDALTSKIQGNYFICGDYRFDVSEVLNDEHLEEACNECIRQVGYIQSANLPKNITNFFKTVSVTLLPQDQLPQTSASSATIRRMYLLSEYAIMLNIDSLYQNECDDYKDQTLLHELLHAFHHQRLGSNNLAILKFFKEAKDHHYYNSVTQKMPLTPII